jgi:HEPN domain-containing protein
MIRPPRTHELTKLYDAACAAGYPLPDLRTECRLLEPYAVEVRYPEQVPIPDEVTGRTIVAAANRIIAACRPEPPKR